MLIVPALIVFMCIADSVTTWYVIKSGIGYETNAAISAVVGEIWFYALKLAITVAAIYAISVLCRERGKLELISYISLAIFYAVIVANNLTVIFVGVSWGFDLPKLFVLFGIIFASVAAVSSKFNTTLHQNS